MIELIYIDKNSNIPAYRQILEKIIILVKEQKIAVLYAQKYF
jgi:DNA-binding transcriptional regulator YhcF (GntR family)